MAVLTSPALRYLVQWAGATVLLAAGLTAFTVLVDPWYVWGSKLRPGFNELKPTAGEHGALAKRHLLTRSCPHTLLLGNSRFEVGIDPASEAWPARMRPVFNAAAAGERPVYSLRMLRLASERCVPRLAVLAVDFPDFLQVPSAPAVGKPADVAWQDRAAEALAASLSLSAVIDSIRTLLAQHNPDAPTLTVLGHNPLAEYRAMALRSGYYSLFAQKQLLNERELRTRPAAALERASSEPMRVLAETIAYARSAGVALVLVLPPYHASYLDLLDQTGRMGEFVAWKAAVTAEAREGGARLLDFSLPHPLIAEAIPAPGDRTTVPLHYWESGHFKAALGDHIIRRVAGDEADGFGVELAPGAVGHVVTGGR